MASKPSLQSYVKPRLEVSRKCAQSGAQSMAGTAFFFALGRRFRTCGAGRKVVQKADAVVQPEG
jgi:hypothetical protein